MSSIHKSNVVKAEIRIGEGVISIRRRGISEITTARILGFDLADDGRLASLYLDRLIHTMSESEIGTEEDPWQLGGAFVSTLTKKLTDEELLSLAGGPHKIAESQ